MSVNDSDPSNSILGATDVITFYLFFLEVILMPHFKQCY